MNKEKLIDLSVNKFNKKEYLDTINTEFNELGNISMQEEIDNEISVTDFFELYNNLFYDIPENGETNSHEYLIKKSSDYINFEFVQEEIEALQVEISILRKELLEEQIKNLELQTGTKINKEILK